MYAVHLQTAITQCVFEESSTKTSSQSFTPNVQEVGPLHVFSKWIDLHVHDAFQLEYLFSPFQTSAATSFIW